MRNMLVQSIKQLKRQKEMKKTSKGESKNQEEKKDTLTSPKRAAPAHNLPHRSQQLHNKAIFQGYVFCFPFADSQITPKQIELLSDSIAIEGGEVIAYKQKPIERQIDFLLINPTLKPEVINSKVQGKLSYKQMLDYRFITDCLKEGKLRDFERYSLYVNVRDIWSAEQNKESRKKFKRESDSDTIRLSEDKEPERTLSKTHLLKQQVGMPLHDPEDQIVRREQLEDYILSHKHTVDHHSFSMNKFIAEELTKLMKIYETERDIGRKIAYMKAAAVIRNLDKEIQSERDVENIKGIGKKISDKIKELLQTGKISKLQKLQGSEKNIILGQLCKVWGIGPSKAQQLYNMGIKSIEQLRKRTDLLTKNQKIGLKYHQEFQQKIPRQKVSKMFEYVKGVISKLVPSLEMYRIEVCGSYRRGKPTCGDMDIIISRKDGVYEKNLLSEIVHELEKVGFLTDHLTTPKHSDTRTSISYMGVCQFQSPIHHRIDIKYYPIEEFAYAILYFTGSGTFNRMMRLHCMKLGLNLSDHAATPKNEKGVIWSKPIPTCYTQQDIFKFLGLDYKVPQQRDM